MWPFKLKRSQVQRTATCGGRNGGRGPRYDIGQKASRPETRWAAGRLSRVTLPRCPGAAGTAGLGRELPWNGGRGGPRSWRPKGPAPGRYCDGHCSVETGLCGTESDGRVRSRLCCRSHVQAHAALVWSPTDRVHLTAGRGPVRNVPSRGRGTWPPDVHRGWAVPCSGNPGTAQGHVVDVSLGTRDAVSLLLTVVR